jgi:hypothetical protein
MQQEEMEMRARACLLTFAVPLAIATGACFGALADDSSQGDDHGQMRKDEQLVLKTTIDVGGNGLGAFDISFVDPKIELYILADRTNGSIDLVDSADATFLGRIGSVCPTGNPAPHFCFQGVVLVNGVANNSLSGPDGDIIVDHKEIWAGDGDSRVKVIDIASNSFVTTISTGGKFRVDEMAYDPRDHILAAANNADAPPFVTLFDTNKKSIITQITFDGTNNTPPATDTGIEQPQWSRRTGLFYVSVPDFTTDSSGAGVGGVSVIDPSTNTVVGTFLVKNCNPAGLAVGPHNEALIGCSGNFGSPKKTQSLIIDITSTDFTNVDGAVVATVRIGGSDEVWYDPGTQHYFLAARNNLTGGNPDPILGSIDAKTHQLDPSVSSSLTAHSVAADKNSHLVFLPIGIPTAGTSDPTNICPTTGCIAVYNARGEHSDKSDRMAQD